MKAGKYIIALLFLWPSVSYGQTVDFSYSTVSGLFCNPERVTFTQLCTGNPDGFIWRFGNGTSGIQPIDYATYSAPGTYPVTLIAIYADVAISVTKNIVINPTPAIAFTADRYQLCQPGTINFTASGSPFIASYEWDFGDGSPIFTTTGNTTSHFFNTFNEFIVTVKGTSGAGCFASAMDTVKIERFGILDGSIDKPGGCIPINVQLTVIPDPPAGDPVVSYIWNFGDGSPTVTTALPSANHLYNTTNTITTAHVIITTASGCSAQHNYLPPFGYGTPPTDPVAVTEDGRSTYCASEIIRFNSSATGADYFVWNYGDGIVDSINAPISIHRYRVLGPMQVIMTPYFHGCPGAADTINLDIVGVVADYKYRNICSAKNHFIYDNLSLGNVSSFAWNFSDIPGSPDITNYHTSHTFPTNGSFTTEYWLYDAITGCYDTLITNQYTATPVLTSSRTHVCKDSIINYRVLNPYPPGSGYLYTFYVDGPIVANTIYPELELKPDLQGVFNEFVIISGPDTSTCDDTVYLPHPTYVGGPVLQASFLINTQCFKDNSFPITNTSFPFFPNDTITTWHWDFGDGQTSSVAIPPPHSYGRSATFWVHFKVTDKNGCAQKDSQLLYVHPTPEIYVLPRKDTICAGESLQLLAFTVDQLTWTTNTNISCLTCDTVTVRPLTSTSYIAEAVNWAGCTNRDTSSIKVYEPFTLRVTPADTAICIGGKVQFNANVKGVTAWLPPRYLNADDIANPFSVPDSTIQYQVIVQDSVACFADTAYATIQVNYLPTVNAGNDLIVPYNNVFTVSPAYSADVVAWQWSPGLNGLSCASCPVFNGTALQTATHQIEVKNIHGCMAKDEVKIIVDCSKANLLLPTAFTPDNNGRNDWFYPLTRGYRTINKMVVYNRWGNKVFERNNFAPNTPSLGWSGRTSDLQGMDTGVYVWYVEATCDIGETVQMKGTVTLLR